MQCDLETPGLSYISIREEPPEGDADDSSGGAGAGIGAGGGT